MQENVDYSLNSFDGDFDHFRGYLENFPGPRSDGTDIRLLTSVIPEMACEGTSQFGTLWTQSVECFATPMLDLFPAFDLDSSEKFTYPSFCVSGCNKP